MNLSLKITGVFLIFALLTSCAAATENKDLPTKEEITVFIADIPVSNNYINTVFDTVREKQPAWNCDIWVDKNGNQILSLYYVDRDSAKGYGAIYFNELGEEISIRGVELTTPVRHYVGDASPEKDILTGTEEGGNVTGKAQVENGFEDTSTTSVITPTTPVATPDSLLIRTKVIVAIVCALSAIIIVYIQFKKK